MTSGATILRLASLALATCLAAAPVSAAAEAGMAPTGLLGAVMEYDPGLSPAFTVYRPRDLGKAEALPVVAWGNGACMANGGAGARPLLLQLASEGYLIIALGRPGPDPEMEPLRDRGAPPPLGQAPPGADETKPEELKQAIDWAIAENRRPGSIYEGRLNPAAVAVMGHSCGGLQALAVQDDPRIVTTMIWHSGAYDRPAGRIGVRVSKEDLAKVTRPIAYIHGGETDIAYPAAISDFALLPPVPAVLLAVDLGHGGTLTQPNGGTSAEIAQAWLDWWLKGDAAAAEYFKGARCGLCAKPGWKVTTKNLP